MQINSRKTLLSFSDTVRVIVKNIPKGKTLSYKEVASRAGNSKAAHVVARIMALNYDPKIPCHRVIRADGSLGGYNRGGTAVKQQILLQESVNVRKI